MEESGRTRALGHTYDIHSKEKVKIFNENMKILNFFAEFCNRKNAELILIIILIYHTYRKNLNKEQLNKMVITIDNFATKHNNWRYFNWHEDPDFITKDFHDADHLDEAGAKKTF